MIKENETPTNIAGSEKVAGIGVGQDNEPPYKRKKKSLYHSLLKRVNKS